MKCLSKMRQKVWFKKKKSQWSQLHQLFRNKHHLFQLNIQRLRLLLPKKQKQRFNLWFLMDSFKRKKARLLQPPPKLRNLVPKPQQQLLWLTRRKPKLKSSRILTSLNLKNQLVSKVCLKRNIIITNIILKSIEKHQWFQLNTQRFQLSQLRRRKLQPRLTFLVDLLKRKKHQLFQLKFQRLQLLPPRRRKLKQKLRSSVDLLKREKHRLFQPKFQRLQQLPPKKKKQRLKQRFLVAYLNKKVQRPLSSPPPMTRKKPKLLFSKILMPPDLKIQSVSILCLKRHIIITKNQRVIKTKRMKLKIWLRLLLKHLKE